ncbi:unnamed protein product [Mytilus edulis]|uniref:Uncharacterized protein n=1 Tax=Mytilus edulis TaxID=6550 RepID=A0A8S3PV91_MYTED|nr:unnamed protein product [Mytilus edulis]
MVAGRPGTHGTLAHQHVELDNTEEDVIVIILHLQMVVQSVKGGDYEYRLCSPSLCPVDTGWSAWDSWGVCNVTCGTGQQSRRRYCKNYDSAKGGAYCQGEEYDFNSCLLSSCLDPEHQQSTNIPIVVGTVSGVLLIIIVIILVVIYAKRYFK